MNAAFFGLAFLAALNPKLLGVDLLLIQSGRPRAMFACFLAGCLAVALAAGLLDVFVVHADAIKTQGQISAGLDWPSACRSWPSARWSQPAACTAGTGPQARPRPGPGNRRGASAGAAGLAQAPVRARRTDRRAERHARRRIPRRAAHTGHREIINRGTGRRSTRSSS
jgi:hypothetical protein